jgi:hypothetical protein
MPTTHADDLLELVLDQRTCLELVDRCGAGTLACTVRAMPSVVPVNVRVTSSEIQVAVDRLQHVERLVGQIVALGAGVAATPRSQGWWVVVRGELCERVGHPRWLLLRPFEVEGRALPATSKGLWWRC